MIVISAGMQKSGSAYIYNIINDLLILSGNTDARIIKEKYNLEDLLKWHNNNVGDISFKNLIRLLFISFKEETFVIKTHSGPSKWMKRFLKLRLIKIIYIYRDPRDVYLSAVDHGKKIVEKGENHTFTKMLDQRSAIETLNSWIQIWKRYNNTYGILTISYEDLLDQPQKKVNDILKYLNIRVHKEEIDAILNKYDRNNPDANKKGLHFNQARVQRYKSELSEDVRRQIEITFGKEIEVMGYEL